MKEISLTGILTFFVTIEILFIIKGLQYFIYFKYTLMSTSTNLDTKILLKYIAQSLNNWGAHYIN